MSAFANGLLLKINFFQTLSSRCKNMKETTYRIYDIAIKIVALAGSCYAFFWGVHEFNQNAEREFKKPYIEQQMQTCLKVVGLVANVASIKINSERAAKLDELSILYFGKGSLFLNGEALNEFRSFIDLVAHCKNKEALNECHYMNMGGIQRNVALACRNELIMSWGIDTDGLLSPIKESTID